MADKVFTEGMIIKAPHQNAPSFVKLKLSFKAEDFRKFLNDNAKNGWVNVDVKESKDGKLYGELDTYERAKEVTEIKQEITKKLAPTEDPMDNFTSPDENGEVIDVDSIPF
jgi:hypothetical protein